MTRSLKGCVQKKRATVKDAEYNSAFPGDLPSATRRSQGGHRAYRLSLVAQGQQGVYPKKHNTTDLDQTKRMEIMTERTNRRTFLGRAALAAGAISTGFTGREAAAVEPVTRAVRQPKFKLTLAAYSYRNLLTGSDPECTLEDFLHDCARFGLEGAEPTSYYFPKDVDSAYLCKLKGLAFRLGLSISSTAVGNDFCVPPGPDRDRQIADVKKWIERAAVLGAPVIRIFSGNARGGQTRAEAVELAVAAIEECCAYAGEHGIYLGLENHGGLTSTADGMLEIVRAVQSPWFGAWMDSGNFHSEDVYGELEKIAPYTLHVQVKVVTTAKGEDKRPTDFHRLAGILRDVGYRGWICLEYEESEDPRKACPVYLEQLREAFA
jgi:sugar phosphate isomerase/epimerase